VDYELQARVDELAGGLRERLGQVRVLQERAGLVRAAAQSRDGLISVEVGAHGELLDVRLDPGVYERLSPQRLAGVIVELARVAAADAAGRVREVMAPVLPAEGDLGEGGSPTLGVLGEMARGLL
jgi:DNA-binding protein YbaB